MHLKAHIGEKSYKCNMCNYKSVLPGSLRTHLKIYIGEKSNKCNQDNCASFQVGTFKNTRWKKSKVWFFFFIPAGALKVHLKTHSREKSNKYSQCDYAPFQAYHLKTQRGQVKQMQPVWLCIYYSCPFEVALANTQWGKSKTNPSYGSIWKSTLEKKRQM